MSFIHLHVHTEYSLLDGACRIEDACSYCAENGMKALAITDHGVMYGVIEFVNACLNSGIKPVIGCEIYLAPGSRFSKGESGNAKTNHLVLLAETNQGYKNLMKIVTIGFLEGFYYRPRVDLETLDKYSKGLIALTACMEGEIPSLLHSGRYEQACAALGRYIDIFGKHNVFLEIQRNGVQGQEEVNKQLIGLSQSSGVPVVATNDCHYLRRSDAGYHDILLAIQTGTNINDPSRLRFTGDQFYLRPPEEMKELFKDIPQAVENTLKIGERCNVEFDFDTAHLPEFPVPKGKDAFSYLREQALQGLSRRLAGKDDPERKARLEHELSMIKKMSYSSYFLVVSDFVNYARGKGIAVGPGRGSAAGSLVAYSLGITDIDPLENDLVFERFLNPERVTMPDIDIDFQDDRRDEVINYVKEKYGHDRVAQIATFGTMAARGAVRDVGRALAMPYGEVDKIAKMIPFQLGMTISRALDVSAELRDAIRKAEIETLIKTAQKLEGMPRHVSTHAAGVVLGKDALWEYVPLSRSPDGGLITQFSMNNLEQLGLLKMDFLGLRTLTVIEKTRQLVESAGNKSIDPSRIPLDDQKTYEMLSAGESLGVFQLESSWVRDFLKELKPECFEDVIASVALCRPGPMEQIPEYIRARYQKPRYLHPILEPCLKETYGVIVYQEQILRIASAVGGFSLGEADILRRAVGKKNRGLLLEMKTRFLEGAISKGLPGDVAQEIYELILRFADYGFPRNHAAPYALLAYRTAYLKANYPREFMAALLSSVERSHEKLGIYWEEARRIGLRIYKPCINKSRADFSVEKDGIRYGLAGIKNVGKSLAQAIVEDRNVNGEFRSIEDFVRRNFGRMLTKKSLESLIRSGACDELGTRYSCLEQIEGALESRRRSGNYNQTSLFDSPPLAPERESYASGKEVAIELKLSWERELLGVYFSGHPLQKYKDILQAHAAPISRLQEMPGNERVCVGGWISSVKRITTKKGEQMGFITVEDDFGSVEVIVFPKLWQRVSGLMVKENVVLIRGNVEDQEENHRILAEDITDLEEIHRITISGKGKI